MAVQAGCNFQFSPNLQPASPAEPAEKKPVVDTAQGGVRGSLGYVPPSAGPS